MNIDKFKRIVENTKKEWLDQYKDNGALEAEVISALDKTYTNTVLDVFGIKLDSWGRCDVRYNSDAYEYIKKHALPKIKEQLDEILPTKIELSKKEIAEIHKEYKSAYKDCLRSFAIKKGEEDAAEFFEEMLEKGEL